jgi:hypothetical protein
MKRLRELRVWQKAMDLVEKIYLLTGDFPKQETSGLSMAQASLVEVETQLEIATRLKYLRSNQLAELLPEISALGKQLYALRNALLRG